MSIDDNRGRKVPAARIWLYHEVKKACFIVMKQAMEMGGIEPDLIKPYS